MLTFVKRSSLRSQVFSKTEVSIHLHVWFHFFVPLLQRLGWYYFFFPFISNHESCRYVIYETKYFKDIFAHFPCHANLWSLRGHWWEYWWVELYKQKCHSLKRTVTTSFQFQYCILRIRDGTSKSVLVPNTKLY